MKETIVLYPSPLMGHLISMVELGKRFLQLNPPFSITILISHAPYNTGSTTPYIRHVQSTFPSISFQHVPPISFSLDSSSPYVETIIFRFAQLNNSLVHQSLLTISKTSAIRALIFDFFCYPVLDSTTQLGIPAFCFFTSPATFLASWLYFPTMQTNFNDLRDKLLHCPGVLPFHSSSMPAVMLDRDDEGCRACLTSAKYLRRCSGILINTFNSVEPRAIKAISEGACIPNNPTPPIYCVGPLIAAADEGDGNSGAECLEWLDSQPSRSVVFLCFGSLGVFSAAQLKEIAVGLERSEQRFLWVMRSPATDDPTRRFLAPPVPDLDILLPAGFLERTKERGMVVKSWAPQVAVMSKDSVGGFVTHCGWNSVLEALCAGVPMIAWPLYAEQRLNRVMLVEDMKLAMAMEGAEKGWVGADEVEKRVRELMESEEGKKLRERTIEMKQKAKAALSESGSSHSSFNVLVESWT